MDIKWRDGEGNILNANKERVIYLDVDTDMKTTLRKEEIRKITIDDGLMNIFKDFDNDLALTIVIPKKNKRNAVKIFNEYDKTGRILKGKSNNFLIDLILESSVITGNPLTGLGAILFIFIVGFGIFTWFATLFGDVGLIVARIIIVGIPIYSIATYILLKIKRKNLKEQ